MGFETIYKIRAPTDPYRLTVDRRGDFDLIDMGGIGLTGAVEKPDRVLAGSQVYPVQVLLASKDDSYRNDCNIGLRDQHSRGPRAKASGPGASCLGMKTLLINESREWSLFDGQPFLKVGSAIWMDDGKLWAVFTVEDVVYNADVRDYIRAKGP
jgi:hypothetical protein